MDNNLKGFNFKPSQCYECLNNLENGSCKIFIKKPDKYAFKSNEKKD